MTDEERKALNAIGKHEAAPAVTEREKLLDEAKAIVCGDRDQQYGRPEENFGIIAELWSNYLRHSVSSRDVAMMMILFKVAREATFEKGDSGIKKVIVLQDNKRHQEFILVPGYGMQFRWQGSRDIGE